MNNLAPAPKGTKRRRGLGAAVIAAALLAAVGVGVLLPDSTTEVDAARQQVADLTARADLMSAELTGTRADNSSLADSLEDAEADLVALGKELEAAGRRGDAREQKLDRRDKALDQRAKTLDQGESDLDQREEALDQRASGLDQRKLDLRQREQDLDQREQDLDQREQDLNQREPGAAAN